MGRPKRTKLPLTPRKRAAALAILRTQSDLIQDIKNRLADLDATIERVDRQVTSAPEDATDVREFYADAIANHVLSRDQLLVFVLEVLRESP